eukprot:jgi/Hompol1/1296/HPOL_004739-RA
MHTYMHLNTYYAAAEIAMANGGSRAVALGHGASVQYVLQQLSAFNASLRIWTQDVKIKSQFDLEPPKMQLSIVRERNGRRPHRISSLEDGVLEGSRHDTIVFEPREDVAIAYGSGSATIRDAELRSFQSCESSSGAESGKNTDNGSLGHGSSESKWVAVIHPKSASAVVFLQVPGNQLGYPHPLPPSPQNCARTPKYEKAMSDVAVLSLSDVGAIKLFQALSATETERERRQGISIRVLADIRVRSSYKLFDSKNVLAESREGQDDQIVLFGSHLDSVPSGPGVNDDGSGAMATLELAQLFHELSKSGVKPVQKLRFAWWTGEEIGLLGSRFYVDDLKKNNATLLARHKVNIDTDMIGSPNFVRGVWSGDALADATLRRRCSSLSRLFVKYFDGLGLPTVPFAFNGRSDFQPFIDAGIPAGGVITGEDEIKTHEQAELFGGIAGMVLD